MSNVNGFVTQGGQTHSGRSAGWTNMKVPYRAYDFFKRKICIFVRCLKCTVNRTSEPYVRRVSVKQKGWKIKIRNSLTCLEALMGCSVKQQTLTLKASPVIGVTGSK